MRINPKIALVVLAAVVSTSAYASSYTWNLVPGTSGAIGTTSSVMSNTGNISLAFSGYTTATSDVTASSTWLSGTWSAAALYAMNGGTDNMGYGINAMTNHEITPTSVIAVDVSGLVANQGIKSLQVLVDNVNTAAGETYKIWGSSSIGGTLTLLYTGTQNNVTVNIPGFAGYKYISIAAAGISNSSVLLQSLTASTVASPEPGTFALGLLAGAGLLSRTLVKRYKKRKA